MRRQSQTARETVRRRQEEHGMHTLRILRICDFCPVSRKKQDKCGGIFDNHLITLLMPSSVGERIMKIGQYLRSCGHE